MRHIMSVCPAVIDVQSTAMKRDDSQLDFLQSYPSRQPVYIISYFRAGEKVWCNFRDAPPFGQSGNDTSNPSSTVALIIIFRPWWGRIFCSTHHHSTLFIESPTLITYCPPSQSRWRRPRPWWGRIFLEIVNIFSPKNYLHHHVWEDTDLDEGEYSWWRDYSILHRASQHHRRPPPKPATVLPHLIFQTLDIV